jgi:hypothetical protein
LDVYSHVLPHMQDDAAAKVEGPLIGRELPMAEGRLSRSLGNVVSGVSAFVSLLAGLEPKQRAKTRRPNQQACGGLRS